MIFNTVWRRFLAFLSRLLILGTAALAQDAARAQQPAALEPDRLVRRSAASESPGLPLRHYQVTSPVDGLSYTGYIVGPEPSRDGARTVTIPVILIPFIVQFTNTTAGFTTTFDPTSAPDPGCTAGLTAMSLVEQSPLFQNYRWILNGVDMGVTQYVDAYQRANLRSFLPGEEDNHVLLTYTVGEPLTLPLAYTSATAAAEVRVNAASTCTNPSGPGSVNAGPYQGVVDYGTLDRAMTGYIASHGIKPSQLAIFITYNVMYSQNGLLFLGGYHFFTAPYPQALISPGQTYILANFRSNGMGPFDVSILSHEIAEWVNDPGGFNAVPAWGNIGEVSGCKRFLEVGDPLTMTELPTVAGPNGFVYHLQELAYLSWFFRTPSTGTAGLFSDNGTLASDAGRVCR